MSGAVGSMPSLTRNGRPSSSFRSSSPLGSTSTALRVRSATLIAASLLPRRGRLCRRSLRGLDRDRLDLVCRLLLGQKKDIVGGVAAGPAHKLSARHRGLLLLHYRHA